MRGHLNTDVRARGSNSQPLDPEFDTLDRLATDPLTSSLTEYANKKKQQQRKTLTTSIIKIMEATHDNTISEFTETLEKGQEHQSNQTADHLTEQTQRTRKRSPQQIPP